MSFLNLIYAVSRKPEIITKRLGEWSRISLPRKLVLNSMYKKEFGRCINWKNPLSFNEKLNWLKIYDNKDFYHTLVDKYEVKKFVANLIGEEYVIPNLGVWDSADDIDFSKLPEKFVLKTTHDSTGSIIYLDKNDFKIDEVRARLNYHLRHGWYNRHLEWPYKNVKRRVIADTLIGSPDNTGSNKPINDYKFWCFNGKPEYMYVTVKTHDGQGVFENFYDMDFNPVDINHGFERHKPEFERPKNFEKMKELAEKLATASKAPFIRIDFFNVEGKIYFGEFTFYDWGGMRPFNSYDQDLKLGSLIKL